ncbi:unnamed protein product, partial [Notodromas monacha]
DLKKKFKKSGIENGSQEETLPRGTGGASGPPALRGSGALNVTPGGGRSRSRLEGAGRRSGAAAVGVGGPAAGGGATGQSARQEARNRTQEELQRLLKEIEEADGPQLVKLGDASIAAPFTSKMTSVLCG